MFKVIEKFVSIDGEGPSAGELAAFIRFEGCDLRCVWCDTTYSFDGSTAAFIMSAAEIYQFIKQAGVRNVTLTGGEPLIQQGITDLIAVLANDSELTIRIETHGGVALAPFKKSFTKNNVQFIVDFKLPDSKMMEQMCWPNLKAVAPWDTYKFVIASMDDLREAINIVWQYNLIDRCQVYFSPVADLIEPKIIAREMIKEKLNGVKLQLQLHKYIWPKEMRGV